MLSSNLVFRSIETRLRCIKPRWRKTLVKYALSFVFKSHGSVILLSQIIHAKRIFSVLSSMSVLEMSFSYVLQRFVTAKAKESEILASTSDGNTRCDKLRGKMSGEEARTFYETVLSSESSNREGFDYAKALTEQELSSKREKYKQNNLTLPSETKDGNDDFDGDSKCNDLNYKIPCSRSRISSKCVSSYSNHRIVNQFLQSAQEGRLRQVKDMLSSHSIDIDVCDQFSWTALMCASHSGQVHVVKYLLEKGADWRLHKDLQGRTALDLAIVANHFDIVELLRSYNGCIKSEQWKADLRENKHSTDKTKFWCSVCEQEFTDDQKVHKGSTVHLFNIQRKPQKTFYYIPEGNVGYQMMLKSGWNDDKGLGPEGTGRKFPIKTVLKGDRLGLGSKGRQQPRVTHFGPNDCTAVKRRKVSNKDREVNKPRKISRRERLANEKKQKNWERNMRIYMNTE